MQIRFDHLVVSARTLDEGVAWVEERVGVPMGPGGKHVLMGTHNRLLHLGPGQFLEVIAIDPQAPPPARPRWFSLDAPSTRERLARGPSLIHWVVRTDAIEQALPALGCGDPEILALSRGEYRWRIGVPADGALQRDGILPTVIQWEGKHPADALPAAGCTLEEVVLRHPQAQPTLAALRAAGLDPGDPIRAEGPGTGIRARIRTPRGSVVLGE
jgi:hypothetical protein